MVIEGEALWIVSERVAARPLSDLLARRPPTPLRAAEIAREVLSALGHLHSCGWLHGNITASTLLICGTGSVVLDGLAQSVAEEALSGFPPRVLPYDRENETTWRTPERASAPDRDASPSLPPGFLPARSAGGWAALQADAQRQAAVGRQPDRTGTQHLPLPEAPQDAEEDDVPAAPLTPLEARRARDARIVRIGAVTERWAPEQAAPVADGTWQLAPPVGPAADLWALGALLFRVLQGHPPYPEEDAAELVVMVCAEPPSFAEASGELRPVIECLLREDPERRPSLDETDSWLGSMLRDAREPVRLPDGPDDELPERSRRLPVLRFRGHLVRRRPAGQPAVRQGRHRRARATSRRRGRTLLVAALPVALGVTAYTALALTRTGPTAAPHDVVSPLPTAVSGDSHPSTTRPTSPQPTTGPGRHDPTGFQIDIGGGWKRHAEPEQSRIQFTRGELTLTVVPGRDSTSEHPDPLDYQHSEPELAPYRADPDGTADDVRRIDIGADQSLAEGRYSYTSAEGTPLYARNQVSVLDGHYHVILVQGRANDRARIDEIFDRAVTTYRPD
ncbi:protein kinase family protein [Streptomyces griseoaurantiacus]|uniref:serine/threonine protein kinase n=1 Tax=Streptomyces griseoaurantiacus TaxID=68213 RepID=UPI003827E438